MRTKNDARNTLAALGWSEAEINAALGETLTFHARFDAVPELNANGQRYELLPNGRYRIAGSAGGFVPLDVAGDGTLLIVDPHSGEARERVAHDFVRNEGTAGK